MHGGSDNAKHEAIASNISWWIFCAIRSFLIDGTKKENSSPNETAAAQIVSNAVFFREFGPSERIRARV